MVGCFVKQRGGYRGLRCIQNTLAPPVFRIYLSTRLTCQPKRFSAIHHVKRSANSSRPQAIAPPTIPTAAPIINWILRLRKFGIGRRTQRASAPLSRRTVVPMVFALSPNCCEKSSMNSQGASRRIHCEAQTVVESAETFHNRRARAEQIWKSNSRLHRQSNAHSVSCHK